MRRSPFPRLPAAFDAAALIRKPRGSVVNSRASKARRAAGGSPKARRSVFLTKTSQSGKSVASSTFGEGAHRWEQFFWALWAPGIDAGAGLGGGGVWTPTLVNEGYKVIAGEEPTWDQWTTTVGAMRTGLTIDFEQQRRFELLGRSRGVDNVKP